MLLKLVMGLLFMGCSGVVTKLHITPFVKGMKNYESGCLVVFPFHLRSLMSLESSKLRNF